jgi:uncharacterized protein (TIGR02118 family)
MVKLIAIYRMPEDVAAFEAHYADVHTPLTEKMPGLRKITVNEVYGSPAGASDLHLIVEMLFDNKEALTSSMSSPEGRAAGKDLMGFAGKLVSMHMTEVKYERSF